MAAQTAQSTNTICVADQSSAFKVYGGYKWDRTDLTFSYLPDGSDPLLQGEDSESRLFEVFDAKAPRADWQRVIARSFQLWANQSALNFSQVPDDGTAFGAHGDIRIGLGPTRGLATAAGPSRGLRGSRITINSEAAHHNTYDVYGHHIGSVLAHEIGHTIGLAHEDDPNAETIIGWTLGHNYFETGIGRDDIEGVRSLYGARQDDAFDRARRNDDVATATPLQLDSTPVSYRADLTTHTDIDHYRIALPAGAKSLMIAVDARELSLLAPVLKVYDASRQLLGEARGEYGTVASISLRNLAANERLTIQVDGHGEDEKTPCADEWLSQQDYCNGVPAIVPSSFAMGAYVLRIETDSAANDDTTPQIASWHNATLSADVDNDGQLHLRDILTLVTFLTPTPQGKSVSGNNNTTPRIYPDVTGDSRVNLLDILAVVQAIEG